MTRRGFTLVEIVLALGLIAFALVGIFGLLGAATTTSANSDRDTMMVAMASQVMNDLRSVPFDNLRFGDPHSRTYAPSQPETNPSAPVDTDYLFTVEGILVPGTVPTLDTIYICTVKKTYDTTTQDYSPTAKSYNLMNIQLVFQWPASAPEAKRQTLSVYEKIARY